MSIHFKNSDKRNITVTAISEVYTQTELGNEIFKVTRSFIAGTLAVSTRVDAQSAWGTISFTEIGGGFIRVTPAIPVGNQVKFDMQTSIDGVSSEADLLQKVTDLQLRLAQQEKVIEIILAALDERVGKHAFRVWIKALEKSFGTSVIVPDLFGIEGVNPYQ